MDDLIVMAHKLGGRRGEVGLVGASMGGGASLAWAGKHPDRTAFVVGMIALMSLKDLDELLPGYVDGAYGDNYTDEQYGAHHSPVVVASQPSVLTPRDKNTSPFTNVPIKLWYCTDDEVCEPPLRTDFRRPGEKPKGRHAAPSSYDWRALSRTLHAHRTA